MARPPVVRFLAAAGLCVLLGGCGGVRPTARATAATGARSAAATAHASHPKAAQASSSAVTRAAPGAAQALSWTAPPPPWRIGPAATSCGPFDGRPALLRLGPGAILVPAARSGAGSRAGRCGVALLRGGRWRVAALPAHMRLNAEAVVRGGGVVLGTVGTAGGGRGGGPPGGQGGLFVFSGSALRRVALPAGQYVASLLALPAGGYAVGTAPVRPAGGCVPSACGLGRLGVAGAGGVRWYVPPAPAPRLGMPPAPGGVVVGALQGTVLWFGVDGVGVAALNTATGRFLQKAGAHGPRSFPAAAGPIEFFPAAGTAAVVYYAVHRVPGVADAGYWGPLYAATAGGGGSARALAPAPLARGGVQPWYGCIQGGLGAPSHVRVYGARLWVQWVGCQVYEAVRGAAPLARPGTAVGCGPAARGSVEVAFGRSSVYEWCAHGTGVTLIILHGATGAVAATHTWSSPPPPAAGLGPWYPAPGGGVFWTWRYAAHAGQPATLLTLGPAGTVQARSAFPGPVGAAVGAHHLWLLGARGVTGLAAG